MTVRLTRRSILAGGLCTAASVTCGWAGRLHAAERVPSQRIALVIGNGTYNWEGCNDTTCHLNSPVRDATAIRDMFKGLGFQTVLLTNADHTSMKVALAAFQRRAAISDVAAFYYSGHGVELDGYNYLLPTDATSMFDGNDFGACIPLEWGSEAIGGANRLGLMLIDACRDNPYLSAIRKESPTTHGDLSTALAPIDPPNDFLVGYATRGGLAARDGSQNDLSPYAAAILKYISDPRLSVEEALQRVTTSVCDLTSPALAREIPNNDCQQPVVYGVIGAQPHYLIDDETAIDLKIDGPLLTNLKMADPRDPALRSILSEDNPQFQFKYIFSIHRDKPSIYPEFDYFSSTRDGRIRPFFEAEQTAAVDPTVANGTWSLSFPLFDLISRRLTREPIELSSVVFESRNSYVDNTPYASVVTEVTNLFGLTVVNQSRFEALETEIRIDIVGFSDEPNEYFDDLLATHNDLFQHTLRTNVSEYARLELFDLLEPQIPDLSFRRFLNNHSLKTEDRVISAFKWTEDWEEGEEVEVPKGFEKWYRKEKDTDFATEKPFVVIGRIKSAGPSGQHTEADFVAEVQLHNPGVGGGAIPYDLIAPVNLPVDGHHHRIEKQTGLFLDSDKRTFRGLFPIVAAVSSFHEVKVSILGNEGATLYESPWIDTQIYVSRIDQLVAEADLKVFADPFETP